jgi:TonB-dependent starch-binding outer membrane protein SusC
MVKLKFFAQAKKMIPCLCILLLLQCSLLAQNNNVVTGIVKSEDGVALSGASVVAKNVKTKFNSSTTTNEKGLFTFATLPVAQTYSFTISYIGYETQTVTGYTLTEKAKISLAIKLKIKEEANEAVVIVGYGTQKKSSLTGSVTSISTKQMEKQINSNVASSLQGLAPGVEVIQPGGIAGADVSILIRGAASFGSTEPLYVIDGAFSNSSLSSLDPNDIESIEILKDGAAAAIYGSRAANGVILITTKKGRKGIPVIDFNTIYADQTPSKRLNYLNANQWRAFMNQVADNSGIPHDPKNDNPPNPNTNTDWQSAWLQPAPMYSTNLGLSGGNEYSTYNTSIGYLDQKGLTAFSKFKKYNFRINTSYKKNRLTVIQTFSISRREKVPTPTITISRPTLNIFDSLGRYSSGSSVDGVVLNPLAAPFYTERKVNNTYLIGSLSVGYKIINGLEYKLNLGSSYNNFNNLTHTPVYYTYWDANGNGLSQYGNNINSLSEIRGDQFNYNIDNLLNYKKSFGKHYFDALLGTSWYKEIYRSNSINTIADLGAPNIIGTGGTINGQINAQEQEAALLSYFGRVNYDYNGRYLFSASIRNDISSKFAKDYRSGLFPSISAGWNVQKEAWFKSKSISLLKLRASYGELGANFIDPYQFNASLRQMPSPIYSTPISPYQVYVAQIFPINLTWETAVSKNLGVDLDFFENSLTMTIEYFERLNKGLLAKVPAPPSSGQGITQPTGNSASLVPVNSASVQNKGFDFSLGYNKRINDFNINVIGNLSTVQNKVVALGTNVPPIVGPIMSATIGDNMTITKAGFPIGSFYGFQTAGLTDSGTIRIVGFDSAGNKIFKSIRDGGPSDKQIIGSPIPDFTYGFNFSAQYKSFDFTLFFQGVKGGKILNWQKLNNYFNYSGNIVTDVLNSWTPTNTNTNIPKASTPLTSQSSRPSTFFLEDGSYLRLKNLQIGYNFNARNLSKIKIKKLRIYAGVQNLLTITKYTGYDPEVSNNTTFTRNVDLNEYPNSRTYTVGINASF